MTDLREQLANKIQQDLGVRLVAGFLNPQNDTQFALTRLPGSHIVDEDFEGTQEVLYNFEIVRQVPVGDYSALQEAQDQLIKISNYLDDLNSLALKGQSQPADFQFVGIEVQSEPAELTIDVQNVRCGLEIGVTIIKNKYRNEE